MFNSYKILSFFCFLAFALTSNSLFGSQKISIIGSVYSEKHKSINEADVIVFVADTSQRTNGLKVYQRSKSDKNGKFNLELPHHQKFVILCQKNGWETTNDAFSINTNNISPQQKISVQFIMKKSDGYANITGKIINPPSKQNIKCTLFDVRLNQYFQIELSNSNAFEIIVGHYGIYHIILKSEDGELLFQERIKVEAPKIDHDIQLPTSIFTQLKEYPFEVNTDKLTASSETELRAIASEMKSNIYYRLIINCHTDSRGDDDFNLKLSKKQANSLKNCLISYGIKPQRIIADGFGENRLLNGCKNNVKCSNAKHLENRRVEYMFSISDLE
ncbi:OmpA family protein [Flammeovirga sp. SubArs3]|uniref:OmpA family protein n=1 Tax=Flammeovirga sp. SubArs3 TaxID=2995316 RepID=UPI00248C757B|nr:OmpA family protein [Flammeovirga sp. SubArs3]